MESKIWRDDADEYKLEPLNVELVKKAQDKLGIILPELYISILQEQNGGYIKFDSHPSNTPNSWADDHVNVDHILGIGNENSILDSPYLIEEWDLPKNVVLISGDGHSWIALDYRKTKENPPVIFIDVDDKKIIELASNFDSFLKGLYTEEEVKFDEDSLEITRNWTIEEIKIAFSSNDFLEIGHALDYLYINSTDHIQFIEQSIINLLQNSDLEIKSLAANYAHHFNEEGLLSPSYIQELVSILRKDKEIKYYIEMFFSEGN